MRVTWIALLIATIYTAVDAFSSGSFVALRAGLPLARHARAHVAPQSRLKMSVDQDAKMQRARKLADDAKAAMDSAKEAEAKANKFRGKVGATHQTLPARQDSL